jgi:CheY-like chemotaxis protein
MRFKILIIEDEKSLLDTLTLNLQLENFDVYPLTNSVNALDVIQNIKPDLIILDIMLPHMSGIDFYQTLLNQQIKIPTIFLTAKNNKESLEKANAFNEVFANVGKSVADTLADKLNLSRKAKNKSIFRMKTTKLILI